MTWNVLCATNILEFIDDMLDMGFHPNSFVMNFVSNPMFFHPGNLQGKPRETLINDIQDRLTKTDPKFYLYKVYQEMINLLNEPVLDQYAKALYNNLNMIDKQRNLTSSEIFPELYEGVPN